MSSSSDDTKNPGIVSPSSTVTKDSGSKVVSKEVVSKATPNTTTPAAGSTSTSAAVVPAKKKSGDGGEEEAEHEYTCLSSDEVSAEVKERIADKFPAGSLVGLAAHLRGIMTKLDAKGVYTTVRPCYVLQANGGQFEKVKAFRARQLIDLLKENKDKGLAAVTTDEEAVALAARLFAFTRPTLFKRCELDRIPHPTTPGKTTTRKHKAGTRDPVALDVVRDVVAGPPPRAARPPAAPPPLSWAPRTSAPPAPATTGCTRAPPTGSWRPWRPSLCPCRCTSCGPCGRARGCGGSA